MRTNVVRCPRRPHMLAWLETEGGRVEVVARVVQGGRGKRKVVEMRTTAEDLRGRNEEDQEPFSSFGVTTSCGCGGRYDVHLVAVLDGRAQKIRANTTDYRDVGVSYDR